MAAKGRTPEEKPGSLGGGLVGRRNLEENILPAKLTVAGR
jgi:hypothetical protein